MSEGKNAIEWTLSEKIYKSADWYPQSEYWEKGKGLPPSQTAVTFTILLMYTCINLLIKGAPEPASVMLSWQVYTCLHAHFQMSYGRVQ